LHHDYKGGRFCLPPYETGILYIIIQLGYTSISALGINYA